jgi:hypothetical protein
METSPRQEIPAAILPLQAGFRLGPFSVDPAGRIRPADRLQPGTIRFRWRGCTLAATMRDQALTLRATLGQVPSTARDGARRAGAFRMLRSLPGQLPAGWRMRLLPDHRVQLEAEDRLDPPPTAARLLASVTCFALALRPYLELLAEAGIADPSFGTAKVWPG